MAPVNSLTENGSSVEEGIDRNMACRVDVYVLGGPLYANRVMLIGFLHPEKAFGC
jgi:hypothetical protein